MVRDKYVGSRTVQAVTFQQKSKSSYKLLAPEKPFRIMIYFSFDFNSL